MGRSCCGILQWSARANGLDNVSYSQYGAMPSIVGAFHIKQVRFVGFVADGLGGVDKQAAGENAYHKLALGRRSVLDKKGERKTVVSGDSDDLGAFAEAGGANRKAPFLVLAKVHPRTLRPDTTCFAHVSATPAISAPPPVCGFAATARTYDGRSGTVVLLHLSHCVSVSTDHARHDRARNACQRDQDR